MARMPRKNVTLDLVTIKKLDQWIPSRYPSVSEAIRDLVRREDERIKA
jgi:Arc/MetJ-type ribon-helix-helix transcriptional regulator